jgi:hypothetical protein
MQDRGTGDELFRLRHKLLGFGQYCAGVRSPQSHDGLGKRPHHETWPEP